MVFGNLKVSMVVFNPGLVGIDPFPIRRSFFFIILFYLFTITFMTFLLMAMHLEIHFFHSEPFNFHTKSNLSSNDFSFISNNF